MLEIKDNRLDFSITESIGAPRDLVYDVVAHLEAYPDFISDVVSARAEDSDTYKIVTKAAVLKIPSRVTVSRIPGRRIDFELIEGPVDVLYGHWAVQEGDAPGVTHVTLTVHMETGGRGEWLLRMAGKFVESKSNKFVDAFKQRVKAVQRGEVEAVSVHGSQSSLLDRVLNTLRRLWSSTAREPGKDVRTATRSASESSALFTEEHQIETLEALASMIIPPDDFDDGVQGMGFPGVAEVRARYEAGRAELYFSGLEAVDEMAKSMFGKETFIALTQEERTELMEAMEAGDVHEAVWDDVEPAAFFTALWEDVVFLYCTDPETWERIGWPGPSFDRGGYPDYDQAQTFMGTVP